MIRIECHITEEEADLLKKIALNNGRSRKKQCEYYVRKMIEEETK